ncbi:hypothetical protein [Sorangium sp. So ce854]|uniref:linalool dehydratase/isomerase domain-containing protein n=1 Tax=Sorangium sp. So ce854 TaxID=3133322 RepID=UPI003F5F74D3
MTGLSSTGAAPRPRSARRLRRFGDVALSVLVAAAVWLSCLHLFFRREPAEHRPSGALSPRGRALLAHQLSLWEDAAARDATLARMRATNAEWDFMGRTFLVLGLANAALRDPGAEARHLAVMDRVIDETLALERERGMLHFLMPYATGRPFVQQPARSLFVDGEIALMLGARALVSRRADHEAELDARVAEMRARMERSPLLSAESYPDECWTFCNTLALGAMRMSDALRGERRGLELGRRWLAVARARLVDPETGLLVSSYTHDGRILDGPEGSSLWLVAHALLLIDPDFARDQYARARRELGADLFGFGWAREWPRSWSGPEDVDSGPIVPVVGASAGSSGLALLGAAAFGDAPYLRALLTSLDFAAFPIREGDRLRYAASNQVGDAALLHALSAGPLWQRIAAAGGAP